MGLIIDSKTSKLRMTQTHKRSKSSVEALQMKPDMEPKIPVQISLKHEVPKYKTLNSLSIFFWDVLYVVFQFDHDLDTSGFSIPKYKILDLEKRLQSQFHVRRALEKALGYKTSSPNDPCDVHMPKPSTKIIREIAELEYEVVHLEQYLLSLYRKAFDQKGSCASPESKNGRCRSPRSTVRRVLNFSETDSTPENENTATTERVVQRCQSSLSLRAESNSRMSDSEEYLRPCQSQSLFTTENEPNLITLAEHFGTCISDHIPETPNQISEKMIMCMSTIYCKLANPPIKGPSLSSKNAVSTDDEYDSSFDVRLDKSYCGEGFSGPYSTMTEVSGICRDSHKAADVEPLLQNFRSFISRLERVDPRTLKHEEKLAFWINVHNALLMNAFLAYGVPQNNAKRLALLSKAAYNVGGHIVTVDSIESLILGCRIARPGKWLRLFVASRKLKTGDERLNYAIESPEPLLQFALCSGSYSDPAVRLYTPKEVLQELQSAKEEYISATIIRKNNGKIILPKIVESFIKDSGFTEAGAMEILQQCLPESFKEDVDEHRLGKLCWVPHDFSFRYLLSKELLR